MAIVYRGFLSGSYQYWSEYEATPMGVTDVTVINDPALTASHVDRSVYARDGISGSLQTLTGSQPYLLAGPNITLVTNSLGQIELTGSAGGGSGGSSIYRLELLDYYSTNVTTTTTAGQVIFPANQFTGSLVLYGVISNQLSTATASVQLYNITSGAYVDIGGPGVKHISVSGTSPTIVSSVDLISASNFNSSSQAIYELQVSSSNGSSYGFFGGFELRPSGSFTGISYVTSSIFYISGTWQDGGNRLATTSSVSMVGNLGTGYYADAIGSDVYFFASGNIGGKNGSVPGVGVFGGDVVISGGLYGGSPLEIKTDTQITGGLYVSGNLEIGAPSTIGSDVGFFVSGVIGGEGGAVPGVGVFGGDLIVSGNLRFLGGLTGSVPTGPTYWTSPSVGVIKAEASSSLVEVPLLSASLGVQASGSIELSGSLYVSGNMYVSGADAILSYESTFAGDTLIIDDQNTTKDVRIRAGIIEIRDDYNNFTPGHARLDIDNNSITLVGVGSGITPVLTIQNNSGFPTVGRDIILDAGGAIFASASNGMHIEANVEITGSLINGSGSIATGIFSHAGGQTTTASGSYSHAEGLLTYASGAYSHAEGWSTTASYAYSHAEGAFTIAQGDYSHAEGYFTYAFGSASHVEGRENYAYGFAAHAEGWQTSASNNYSHAEGIATIATGSGAHAEGRLTIASGLSSHAEGEYTLASGLYSHAEGNYTTASNFYSHAEGQLTLADGTIAHAEGLRTRAQGGGAHAEGNETLASGNYSHAEGYRCTGSSDYTHAEGDRNVASTYAAHAEGQQTTAVGSRSHTEGRSTQTTINGYAAHAEGFSTNANAAYAHAEGQSTTASGQSAHAEGFTTTASGQSAHAEGDNSTASGNYSHAEGRFTSAIGVGSHAEGQNTISSGSYSHAEGLGTIASGSNQHVQGKYNLRNNNFSLFVIGDGTGDADGARSDILRVNSGSVSGQGRVEVTGSFVATRGLSGSLQRLSNDSPYLLAGPNITITTNSLGQVEISGSAAATPSYWSSTTNNSIFTTGSVLIRSNDGSGTDAATDYGSDNFFYVSGAIGSRGGSTAGVSTFGGDVVVSGNLHIGPAFTIGSDVGFFVSGSRGGQSTQTNSTGLFGGDLAISGNLHQLSGLRVGVNIVTSVTPAYTASILDYIIAVSASAGSGITLPSNAQIGKTYIVKDVSGSATTDNILISGSSGERIDGMLGTSISSSWGSLQFVYFGSTIGWGTV